MAYSRSITTKSVRGARARGPTSPGGSFRSGLPLGAKRAKVYRVQPSPTNDQIDWDTFQPRAYHAHNYRTVRSDDLEIVTVTRDFFAAHPPADPDPRGVDVGPGANLYPTLAMLPFCTGVDLIEHSRANVDWLTSRKSWWRRFDRSWDKFWRLYRENPRYAELTAGHRPLTDFRRKATIMRGSIFDLEPGRWSMGTMFFVACSLSADRAEFDRAVRCFTGSLRREAPFAAAFMTGSDGYEINGVRFPAVSVDTGIIEQALTPLATDLKVIPIKSVDPLRPNVGMALAIGRSRGPVG